MSPDQEPLPIPQSLSSITKVKFPFKVQQYSVVDHSNEFKFCEPLISEGDLRTILSSNVSQERSLYD